MKFCFYQEYLQPTWPQDYFLSSLLSLELPLEELATRLLAAVAVTQVALFHQLTLPGWPVTPLRLAVRSPARSPAPPPAAQLPSAPA